MSAAQVTGGVEASLVYWLLAVAQRTPLITQLVRVAAQRLIFALPCALLALWWWPRNERPRIRPALVAVLVSLALNGAMLLALQYLVDRPRPFVALGLTPLIAHAADSSFPSDHTLLGVALVAPLVWRVPRVGLPLLAVALLVGLARVAAAVHWPSDVAGTAIIALAVGWFGLWVSDWLPSRWRTAPQTVDGGAPGALSRLRPGLRQ